MNARRRLTSSRRHLLRGAGVCLALPWLESLAPNAKAQGGALKRHLVTVSFPSGVAPGFAPTGSGLGPAWELSPELEAFATLKSKLVVLGNVGNFRPFSRTSAAPPGDAVLAAAFSSCVDPRTVSAELGVDEANGISFDQWIASSLPSDTPLASLQVGLATTAPFCAPGTCAWSQSYSWAAPTEPLYKEVNPQAVFDRLFTDPNALATELERRRALELSILDRVLEQSSVLAPALGRRDRLVIEQFMDSVRQTEQQISLAAETTVAACQSPSRPDLSATLGLANGDGGYDRELHAEVMSDLLVLALTCGATSVASYMLDDVGSEFLYDHVASGPFAAAPASSPRAAQDAADPTSHAKISWWFCSRLARLCEKLDQMPGSSGSLLDQCLVVAGSSVEGQSHLSGSLPLLLIGASDWLKGDQHLVYPAGDDAPQLRDLYTTIARGYFDLDGDDFGVDIDGQAARMLGEIAR